MAVGAAVGGGLAFALGVYLGGDTETQTGSIGYTLAGGLAGAALGGGIALLARDNTGVVVGSLITGPVIGSLVGFNLTRRWREQAPVRVGSLLHVDRGHAAIGIPLIVAGDDAVTGSLISGRF